MDSDLKKLIDEKLSALDVDERVEWLIDQRDGLDEMADDLDSAELEPDLDD